MITPTTRVRAFRVPAESPRVRRCRVRVSAVHWTLLELISLVVAAAVAAQFAADGSPVLGGLFLVLVLCTRTAIVDYSLIGSAASGLVLIVGIPFLLVSTFRLFSH